jgi:hypothetical protein
MAMTDNPVSEMQLFMACHCRPRSMPLKSSRAPQWRIFVLTGSMTAAKNVYTYQVVSIIDQFIPVPVLLKGLNWISAQSVFLSAGLKTTIEMAFPFGSRRIN